MRKALSPHTPPPLSPMWRLRALLLLPLILLLLTVSCDEDDGPLTPPVDPGISEIEARVHTLVNQYRVDKGYAPLTQSDIIAAQARKHSRNMADGTVPFSHDGFPERVEEIRKQIDIGGAGENVAMNSGYSDPARVAVEGWLKSEGHRGNIEGNYDLTGIGVAQNSNGTYYLTQIFVKSR
jgi:uncharacterized protein YkwD